MMSDWWNKPWWRCTQCEEPRKINRYSDAFEDASSDAYRGHLIECVECGNKWYEHDHPDHPKSSEFMKKGEDNGN